MLENMLREPLNYVSRPEDDSKENESSKIDKDEMPSEEDEDID